MIYSLTMRHLRFISPSFSRTFRRTFDQNPTFPAQTTENPDSLRSIPSPHRPASPNHPRTKPICSRNGPNSLRNFTTCAQESKPPSNRVSAIVDEISCLTLLQISDLTEALRKKLDVQGMPIMAVMMPGMGFGMRGSAKAGGVAARGDDKAAAAEKTAFDLKLEGLDAAAKLKVMKEVRTFTALGLKEAKDLVEKAPTILKTGVPKEEAEKIIEKMKEAGAKVTME